jgi:hypothetical protein
VFLSSLNIYDVDDDGDDDDDDDDDGDDDDDDDLFSLLFDISSRFVLYNNVLTIFN